MIDHNFTQYGLDETYQGETVLPSEYGNIHTPMSLRQFIQLTRRAYSSQALENLEDSEGLKLKVHNSSLGTYREDSDPFFHFTIAFKPKNDELKTFVESEKANLLFDRILKLIGNSSVRGVSGTRTAFLGEFNLIKTPSGVEVMLSHVFIGKSIFYNDYRVTTNYPSSKEEENQILEIIFNDLTNSFDIALEIEGDE